MYVSVFGYLYLEILLGVILSWNNYKVTTLFDYLILSNNNEPLYMMLLSSRRLASVYRIWTTYGGVESH